MNASHPAGGPGPVEPDPASAPRRGFSPIPPSPAPHVVLLMGVAGSGKSTIGRLLAEGLGWRFADADDFHPAANVAKMRRGEPLTDDDRRPWLDALGQFIRTRLETGERAVVACSALKTRYRRQLQTTDPRVALVHLKGTRALLHARLTDRRDHFMPPALLDSQLAALEEPEPGTALVCDIADPPDAIVAKIRGAFGI